MKSKNEKQIETMNSKMKFTADERNKIDIAKLRIYGGRKIDIPEFKAYIDLDNCYVRPRCWEYYDSLLLKIKPIHVSSNSESETYKIEFQTDEQYFEIFYRGKFIMSVDQFYHNGKFEVNFIVDEDDEISFGYRRSKVYEGTNFEITFKFDTKIYGSEIQFVRVGDKPEDHFLLLWSNEFFIGRVINGKIEPFTEAQIDEYLEKWKNDNIRKKYTKDNFLFGDFSE